MAELPNPLRLVRHDDLLVVDVEFHNLGMADDGSALQRTDLAAEAYLTVHLPYQHVAERAFFLFEGSRENTGPQPFGAIAAGPSRLVFALPEGTDNIPFTADALLDWAALTPRLAANAMPPEVESGPGPGVPPADVTAVELVYRLLLSPDMHGRWQHRAVPFTSQGRTEVWHTSLTTDVAAGMSVRAIARRDVPDTMRTSLSGRDLDDIVTLSSDFGIRPKSARQLGLPLAIWFVLLEQARLRGYRYVPRPLTAERIVLSALGGSARLHGQWDYPPPDRSPGQLRAFGMPTPSLERYDHVTGQGRDQYVRVVRRGFMSSGHRASLVKVTERQFEPEQLRVDQGPHGPVGVFGANAVLRQWFTIIIQEPHKDYGELAAGYQHGGREMPLRAIELTTLDTGKIDLPVPMRTVEARATLDFMRANRRLPADEAELAPFLQERLELSFVDPFWVRVAGGDFAFGMRATDWEGGQAAFTSPLVFVPYEAVENTAKVAAAFALGSQDRRTRTLGGQTLALADPTGSEPGSTRAPVASLTFGLQPVPPERVGGLPVLYRPRWLLQVTGAEAHVEAVQRLTGTREARAIRFHATYLSQGLAPGPNPAGLFADLVAPLPVTFDGPAGGGLARPDAPVALLSSRQGALAKTFAQPSVAPADLASLFGDARLLGTVKLADILADIPALHVGAFSLADLAEAEFQHLLDDQLARIPVPVLRTRQLVRGGAPYPFEARFVWKPPLSDARTELFSFSDRSRMVLDARTVTPLDGGAATAEVRGELRDLELTFFGVAVVKLDLLAFTALPGRKPDITAEGFDLRFDGPLEFINTLKDVLPADGFSDPPAIEVTPAGISAGYTLGIPTVGVGIFSLQNLSLSAALAVPFAAQPASVRFAISAREAPFLVTVGPFGGGGFFALEVSANGVEAIEASIEFGGSISLNLGVASGGVTVMAGIYFGRTGDVTTLTGYLRCGGYLSVLGLISISIEFYLAFTYRDKGGGRSEIWGQATVSVCVQIACFSTSVKLSLERRFAGASGDPSFADCVEPDDWEQYCLAFAEESS
ncbi:MAG: hypothetical protein ACR2MA_00225 [Egibacteraceae bacterium]